MAATVDYLFGFDATANVVSDFMYEQISQAYALDESTQAFYKESNPWALRGISERLLEAAQRGMWEEPNPETLEALRQTLLKSDDMLEGRSEQAPCWVVRDQRAGQLEIRKLIEDTQVHIEQASLVP